MVVPAVILLHIRCLKQRSLHAINRYGIHQYSARLCDYRQKLMKIIERMMGICLAVPNNFILSLSLSLSLRERAY